MRNATAVSHIADRNSQTLLFRRGNRRDALRFRRVASALLKIEIKEKSDA
jgi:hypothetical protein